MDSLKIDVDKIVKYEQGELTEDETIELFQDLINSGLVWDLQGHYGRTAMRLVELGHCKLKTTRGKQQ